MTTIAHRKLDDQYWAWRNAVLKRDKNKCRYPNCKCRTRLEIHHIIRWADCHELRYEVQNGISLCKKHHRSIKNKEYLYVDLFLTIVGNKK